MKQTLIIVGLVAVCAGCANPGVVEIGPGVYDLAREDHGGIFGNTSALRSGVIQDADAFASKHGKVAVPVFSKAHPVGVLGDWASFEFQFRMADTNAPEAHPLRIETTEKVMPGDGTALRPERYTETFYLVVTNETQLSTNLATPTSGNQKRANTL